MAKATLTSLNNVTDIQNFAKGLDDNAKMRSSSSSSIYGSTSKSFFWNKETKQAKRQLLQTHLKSMGERLLTSNDAKARWTTRISKFGPNTEMKGSDFKKLINDFAADMKSGPTEVQQQQIGPDGGFMKKQQPVAETKVPQQNDVSSQKPSPSVDSQKPSVDNNSDHVTPGGPDPAEETHKMQLDYRTNALEQITYYLDNERKPSVSQDAVTPGNGNYPPHVLETPGND